LGYRHWIEVAQFGDVRGKMHPVVPYRIRGELGQAEAGRPFIGRTEELQQFETLLGSCRALGRGRLIIPQAQQPNPNPARPGME